MLPIARRIGARLGHVAHRDVESALAFEERADGAAADRELDHVLDVADVDAVARQRLPIQPQPQLRLILFLLDAGVGRARHLPQHVERLVAEPAQLGEVRVR